MPDPGKRPLRVVRAVQFAAERIVPVLGPHEKESLALHPTELTGSATRKQAAEVVAFGADAHASCNRTCELG